MGKKLLTTAAIRQVINLRSDENSNHTFAEIAVAIQNEFGIEVSMDAVRKAYYKHKDTLPAQPVQVKQNSKLADLVEKRKAEKQAQPASSQSAPTHAPKPVQKPYRPSNSLLDENGEEPEWMKISNMSVPEFKEYKAKKAAEKAAKKAEEENQKLEN